LCETGAFGGGSRWRPVLAWRVSSIRRSHGIGASALTSRARFSPMRSMRTARRPASRFSFPTDDCAAPFHGDAGDVHARRRPAFHAGRRGPRALLHRRERLYVCSDGLTLLATASAAASEMFTTPRYSECSAALQAALTSVLCRFRPARWRCSQGRPVVFSTSKNSCSPAIAAGLRAMSGGWSRFAPASGCRAQGLRPRSRIA
jgi:hypothetical protein